MYILGISAYYHDSAACLLKDGEIIAAAQEERFTRRKHDQNFPINAIKYCLQDAGINTDDLEIVAFYDKPFLKFERILETYLSFAPKGISSFLKAMPLWIKKGFGQYERPLDLLSDFGLLKIKDKYPAEVSGGERQRVAIIRSIVNKPKILFADEPSGNLDEKNSTKLIDLFKKINRDFDTTIMLTTHNPSIAKVGNKVYELKSGILIKK